MDKYNSCAGMNYYNKQPDQSLLQHNQADTQATSSGQFQPPLTKAQNPGNVNYVGGNELAIQQDYHVTPNNSNYVRNDAGVKFALDTVSFNIFFNTAKIKTRKSNMYRY